MQLTNEINRLELDGREVKRVVYSNCNDKCKTFLQAFQE